MLKITPHALHLTLYALHLTLYALRLTLHAHEPETSLMSNVETRPLIFLRTLWAYGFGESHPEGFGLDGLTEQSAKL